MAKKLGRNDICHCGSGAKYKKCCLNGDKGFNVIQARNDMYEKAYADGHIVVDGNDSDIVKMSEIILEYIDELLEDANTFEEKQQCIDIGIMAWNCSLMPDEKLQDIPNYFGMTHEDGEDFLDILIALIDKKRFWYPDINRFITDWNFMKTGPDDAHLQVASTLLNLDDMAA